MLSTKTVTILTIVFVIAMITLIHFTLNYLVVQTAHQCAVHDWPASQEYNHLMWCLDNGYPT